MRDYNNGVTPRARSYPRCHPQKCEVSPPKMRGVTPKNARCHPQKCEVSPPKMRGVTPKNARCHPQKCEVSPPKMRGVTPKNARCHPQNCEASPQKWRGWPLTNFSKITFPEANQLRVLTVHEGHMGHYHH